ncbi:AraC family transcriptional regulator [Actinobacteria bacterium YIM 96077]|uniref:AraC family transcriptional regulator n=1 Tax=Phytoactinopolyspora halophila TaxID=1981511 RepID=A0A329QVQ6_9ACTN|nr:AraC family transcriptional regulator [Actinobacteria bacterium YIM 96077]RAW16504.1 AraC family transcriptional regulator [Phytoactinopolyspora halophila]
MVALLWFDSHARGRPYHAARVRFEPRSPQSDLHGHADFYEILAVTAGSGEHLLADGRRELRHGDVVFIRPQDRHAFRGLHPDGLEFINVAFPAEGWRRFAELAGIDPERTWEHRPEPPAVTVPPAWRAHARAVFESALARYYSDPHMLDLTRFWSDVLAVVAAPRAEPDTAVAGAQPPWLADVCQAMRHEENLRGGVARMVHVARVSPAHLARTMRTHLDTTPTEFVTRLRIERAATLLATSTESITAIAHRCGFSSQSYFTRRFRDLRDVSPREFRRQAQRAFVP